MVVLVKILSQNADMAGAQLTAIVPYSSMTLLTCISDMSIDCSTEKDLRYYLKQSRVPGRIDFLEDQDPQPERYYAHDN